MPPDRPRLVAGGGEPADARVTAVREVLAGTGIAEVARRHDVDVAVLHRWVTAFVDAGTARVTNRPEGDAERQRDRFLVAFAHETRTPLATARRWVELLLDDDLPPAEVAPVLGRLDEALARLADRAQDVELMAAASLGLLRPRPKRVPLGRLLADLEVVVADDVAAATLAVDENLTRRVLRDLVAAAGLPPAPSSVSVEVRRSEVWTDVYVVRQGRPLPPAVLRGLFEPFDLVDDGSAITIGLYLARALAVAHGGTVGVQQDDTATAFWVRVPTRPGTDGEETP